VIPKMGIKHAGQTYLVDVHPGKAGREKFVSEVRKRLNISPEQTFDVSFDCFLPSNSAFCTRTELKGMDAYDAAVFCATVTAAARECANTPACHCRSPTSPM
jgi:hypothetical protein